MTLYYGWNSKLSMGKKSGTYTEKGMTSFVHATNCWGFADKSNSSPPLATYSTSGLVFYPEGVKNLSYTLKIVC